ncbi:MAG: CCA tRNA nucleotidyltransferase [Treponema sp.]|nr:CCA tRNA nucleotidyltransferase [Clostridia bacterium]MBP3607436.1 CCA tRNA nucleotidyltransferase [Treponema sp.]
MKNLDEVKNRIINVINMHEQFKNHVYIVGGYVRDFVMNIEPKDLDLVIDIPKGNIAFANAIKNTYPNITTNPIKLGAYPIRQIQFTDVNETIEIADTMTETFPDKFSRQRDVIFASIEKDIERRDFTINSLLFDLTSNKIVDLANGINDIKHKIIRCNSNVNPEEIFSADPLRILRGIRFSVKYGFNIEEKTFNAMKNAGERINILSNERIYSELKNICKVKKGLKNAVILMDKLDILKYIFPEVDHLKTIYQAPDSRLIHLEGSKYKCKNFSEQKES